MDVRFAGKQMENYPTGKLLNINSYELHLTRNGKPLPQVRLKIRYVKKNYICYIISKFTFSAGILQR